MDKLMDVTVVGGGVVGCFIAYRLALEGIAVTLVEREHVGAGASGASAGNVQPGEFEPIVGAERLNPIEAESLALLDACRIVEALAKAAEKHGVTLRQGEVVGLRREGARVTGVRLKDGSTLACGMLILAMGAWTGPAVAQWLGVSLPIEPYSLQKLHVRPSGPAPACAIRRDGANIVSRLDGLVHVGSKHEHTGFEARPSEDGKRWLLERLQTILPELDAAVVEAKAGLAATLPGRTPILGPMQGLEGVYLAVPSSNGFLLSAVLAHILTELLVYGRRHPFLPMILPERVLQSAVAR